MSLAGRNWHDPSAKTSKNRQICSLNNAPRQGSIEFVDLQHLLALALDPPRILEARGIPPDPWQRAFLLVQRSPDFAQLQPAERQIDRRQRPGPAHGPVHAGRWCCCCRRRSGRAPRFSARCSTPTTRWAGRSRRGYRDAAAAGIGQRLARPVPARPRGDDPLLRRRQSAGARRGRPHSRRSVSQRAAHARRVAGPARRPEHAVRPARLVLRGMGGRRPVEEGPHHLARLPAHHADFIAEETRAMGAPGCSRNTNALFTALEGLVYPDFEQALDATTGRAPPGGPAGGRHRLRLAQSVRGPVGRAGPRRRAVDRRRALPARDAAARARRRPARTRRASCGTPTPPAARRSRNCGRRV